MCIYSVNYALMLHKGLRKPRNHHSRDQVAPPSARRWRDGKYASRRQPVGNATGLDAERGHVEKPSGIVSRKHQRAVELQLCAI
jgi:hypothetical protein